MLRLLLHLHSPVSKALLLLVAIFALACCDHQQEPPQGEQVIRLDQLQPLPLPDERQSGTFRIAIAAVLSPEGNATLYRPLTSYFGKALGRPVQLIQRRNYQEVNDLLARGGVDVAFVCTGAYLQGKEHMSLLVVPRINGKVTYRSYLIVHSSSGIDSFQKLRGKVFAFTDPLSNTGYSHPLSILSEMHEQPETFFARTIFTYSHDRSIYAVTRGLVDGASVDHLVYQYAVQRDSEIGLQTRVIDKSKEYGIPPVVVPARIDPWKKNQLQEIFLRMHESEEGRKALHELGIERFEIPDADLY
jgi:phosphonate transport system substrate-binding protein